MNIPWWTWPAALAVVLAIGIAGGLICNWIARRAERWQG